MKSCFGGKKKGLMFAEVTRGGQRSPHHLFVFPVTQLTTELPEATRCVQRLISSFFT